MPVVNLSALRHYCRPHGMKQILLPKWQIKQIWGGGGAEIEEHMQSFNPCICLDEIELSCIDIIAFS